MDDIASDRPADDDEERYAHRRSASRDSLLLRATLRRAGDQTPLTMRVRNLSAGGMMAEIGEPFRGGDRIEIELRGIGMLEGTVMWREDDRIGIAFDHTIDPRLARKAVAQRATPARPAPTVPPPRAVKRPKLFGE